MKNSTVNICSLMQFGLGFLFSFLVTIAQAQDATSLDSNTRFEKQMLDLTSWANLRFFMPKGFVSSTVSEDVKWPCGSRRYTIRFNAVLKNQDSSVMIGIHINSKRPSTIPGKIVAADVNWKLNAKNHFEAVHDRENNHPNYIQKDTLEKIWKTDYGVEYSRACTIPYKSRFSKHRIITIGREDFELEVVYFFLNEAKDLDFVKFTSQMFIPLQ